MYRLEKREWDTYTCADGTCVVCPGGCVILPLAADGAQRHASTRAAAEGAPAQTS